MKGPRDGSMTTYHFGGGHHADFWKVEAPSLARAIRLFRVGVLFPHAYTAGRIAERVPSARGYEETIYRSSAPGSTIRVQVRDGSKREWLTVAEIPPEDASAEYQPGQLPAAVDADAMVPGSESTALAPATHATGLAATTRRQIEDRQLELNRQMGELERQRHELQEQVSAMKSELERRMEQIWMIELFLGSKETVHQLRDGTPAPSETPISIRQRVLCMDEELAVWHWLNDPAQLQEFDFENLEDFDAWVLRDPAHLDSLLPEPKGIVALRVRRTAKERPGGDIASIMAKIHAEEADAMVYLLVRNGEKLFRLWVDVNIWPRFFPRVDEWDWIGQGSRKGWESFDRRDAKKQAKNYLAGLVVVQGLVERSELFHPLPVERPNVFDPSHAEEHFRCIRDDEGRDALGDGEELQRLTWKSYSKWLREQVAVGVRVLWDGSTYGEYSKVSDRTHNRQICAGPSKEEPHTIAEDMGDDFGWKWNFLYLPDETIWTSWEGKKRTRRARFCCYTDEVWPVDFVSLRVVEHLLADRSQREHYHRFFHIFSRWHSIKREEAALERPFVNLVLSRAGHDPRSATEATRARAERVLRWWKLKTKTHRTLDTDEAKALRMVLKAFQRGDDFPDDPEKELYAERSGELP